MPTGPRQSIAVPTGAARSQAWPQSLPGGTRSVQVSSSTAIG